MAYFRCLATTVALSIGATTFAENYAPRDYIGNIWMSHCGLNWYDNTARMHDPILMRFTTPDPLYTKYPDLSPWSHCAANPINAIDSDGQEWHINSYLDENGVTHINMSVSGAVYNNSTINFDMNKVAKAINNQLNSIYSFSNSEYVVTMNSHIRAVDSFDEFSPKDHVLLIMPQSYFRNESVLANATPGGLLINLSTTLVKQTLNGSNTATIAHEFGHTGNLKDANLINEASQFIDKRHNLMMQSVALSKLGSSRNSATKLESHQLGTIIQSYNLNRLNRPSNFFSLPWLSTKRTFPYFYFHIKTFGIKAKGGKWIFPK